MTASQVVAPGIRRLLAPNPGMMTGPGTNTYLVGRTRIAVVDPGPGIAVHIERTLFEAQAPVTEIWLTHAHPDHAAGVAALQAATGARLLAWHTPSPTYPDPGLPRPAMEARDGEVFTFDGEAYRVLHTPGHASDHLCFFRRADGVLFTGDVVVGLGTVVIAPPDGNLQAYMESLARLLALQARVILPGHGDPIDDPAGKLSQYIGHRLARERQVLDGIARGHDTIEALVREIYPEADPRVLPVAAQQVHGHLLKLQAEGVADLIHGRWTLAQA